MSRRLVLAAAGLTLAALTFASATPAAKRPAVKCSSGTTLFLQNGIRIFSLPRRINYSLDGLSRREYACRGRNGRPIMLGENYTDERNQGEVSVRAYAFAGSRYLGVTSDYTGGEGCGSSDFILRDVRAARAVHSQFRDCAFGDEREAEDLVVTPTGGLAFINNDAVFAFKPGRGTKVGLISTAREDNTVMRGITARGELVYWTEMPNDGIAVVRSKALGGDSGGRESQAFVDRAPPRRTGSCVRGGTTVARTVLVRVVERTVNKSVRRSACRVTKSSSVALPTGDLVDLQIAADRFVLALEAATATIVDVKTGDSGSVHTAESTTFRQTTFLDDGSLAWIDSSGRLVAQSPKAASATVLAEASAAPTALASRGKTVYWTQADGPHRANYPPAG